VFDPTGSFILQVAPGPTRFACNTGVTASQADPNTGKMTIGAQFVLRHEELEPWAAGALAITH